MDKNLEEYAGNGEVDDVNARYESGEFPDSDDVMGDGGIQVTAMIPRPKELQADVQVAADGSVCFKVPAKQCRIVWRKTASGRMKRVRECFLGEVTICMDRRDWS